MSDVSQRSRSPVRAIDAAVTRGWPDPAQHRRTRNEHAAHPAPAASTAVEQPDLACPGCGAVLRLALVPATTGSQAAPVPDALPKLRAAPRVVPLPNFEESVQRYKRDLLARALKDNGGVMTRAAAALGVKYTTFVAMVHRLGVLDAPDAGDEATGSPPASDFQRE